MQRDAEVVPQEPLERLAPAPEPALSSWADMEAHLDSTGPFDLVVGINTRNVETTIIHVLNVVCTGMLEHFPGLRLLVVVCDGGSSDATVRLANFYPAPGGIEKCVVRQLHGPGKGNGVRTIVEIADRAGAHACACVDGDLVSIHPNWIANLLSPILYGLTDVVVPYYLRDKWDGIITNHLCYPLNAALYGSSVRQPIGGDYSFSRRFMSHVLSRDIPGDFGIDLFVSTTAIAEGFRIQETPLGIKVHASTAEYTDPHKVLSRMYLEVVGMLLELTARHEEVWRHHDIRPPVLLSENVIPYFGRLPPTVLVGEAAIRDIYRGGVSDSAALLEAILPAALYQEVVDSRENGLEADLWARVVYEIVAWHVVNAREHGHRPPDELLHALGALGMGRFLAFVEQTRDKDLQEATRLIKEQAQVFALRKDAFIDRIDELRAQARQHEAPPERL